MAPSKNGYYHAKAIAAETIAHRHGVVPFVELLEGDPRFTVLYHDESQFRVYPPGQQKHIQPIPRKGMTDKEKKLCYNDNLKPNVGPGYQVCTVISIEDRCVVTRDRPGHADDYYNEPVGWIESTVGGEADNHETFLVSVREAITVQQAKHQHQDQIVVLVVDGARTHTTVEDGRSGYIRKADLEEKLKGIGKYEKGLKQPELSLMWKQSDVYRSVWSEAEELAEELGAVLIYNPNAHPYVNPIECLWRAAKASYRQNGKKGMTTLHDEVRAYLGQRVTKESKDSQKRWHHFSIETRRHLYHNPWAERLTENDIKKKTYKLQPRVDLTPLKKLLAFKKEGEIDVQLMQRYAHYLNQARIYLGGGENKFSLDKAAKFDRNRIYERINKRNDHKSQSGNRKTERKEEHAFVDDRKKKRNKKGAPRREEEDDDSDSDEEEGEEVEEETKTARRRDSDDFEPQGVKRELENAPARPRQRRKASKGVRFDLDSSDDSAPPPASPPRPPPPPPTKSAPRAPPVKAGRGSKSRQKPKVGRKSEKDKPKRKVLDLNTNVKIRDVQPLSTVIDIEPYTPAGPEKCEIGSICITHDQIGKVVEKWGGLLNDEAMNGVITLMQPLTLNGVTLMTTYEFAGMYDDDAIKRKYRKHMKRGRFQDVHTIIYPCHINTNHWVVVVANKNDRRLRFYDSLNGTKLNRRYLPDFLRLLWPPAQGKEDEWEVTREDCGKQMGNRDCGVFCLDNVATLVAGNVPSRATCQVQQVRYKQDMTERRQYYGRVLRQKTLEPK